jgi:hypothetical protein
LHRVNSHPRDRSWYEVRLRGRLDPRWSEWFDGLTVATATDGTTTLRGPVADQAALHGLLRRLGDLGLPLISLSQVTPTTDDPHAPTGDPVMTTTAAPTRDTHDGRRIGDPTRNHARAAGILYLITFAASLPAFALIGSAVNADLTVAAGHGTELRWAGLLDFITALAGVGTAVALYPVLKYRNQAFALGFVTSRLVEAAVIMTGVVSLLAVVTVQQNGSGDDPGITAVSQGLVAVRNWTFLFGPGFMASLNAVLLGTLLYRSRLVPRLIPTMGLVGAPLLLAANLATLFGHNEQTSGITMLATLPVACWELSVGIWMTVKGFNAVPATATRPALA